MPMNAFPCADCHSPIRSTIERLRQLVRCDIQSQWRAFSGDRALAELDVRGSDRAIPDEKGYLSWEGGRKVQWFCQEIALPDRLAGYPLIGLSLHLFAAWWAELAEIFLNGQLIQSGDLFDSSGRILLVSGVRPGETLNLAIRLISPGHDIGALMESQLIYEALTPDPGFVADELAVLERYLAQFDSDALELAAAAIAEIDWNVVGDREAFDGELRSLREKLKTLAFPLKERRFHLLGHAHLDMAWLWTAEETWQVGERTFRSVLQLQQEFSSLTFGHTSPALYAWIERHRPELFQAIQRAVRAGKWELLGGMWIEPEMNLLSGESIARQLLYGQGYYQAKFGERARVAWLIDSFGFCWQMPQLLQQGGIDYFVTGKLHWNDSTAFPHGFFYWRSPDGSQILTLMSPPNVAGVVDTHPLTMADYALEWERQTHLKDIFWIPGVGDHGGGPTREMLQVARRWQDSPFFPEIAFDLAIDYLQSLEASADLATLPVWQDELYLEFHRGCYTTHADQKAANRRSEVLLFQAELWSAIACWLLGSERMPYPHKALSEAWKKVSFNQFHDILPGTSIPEVFAGANRDWDWAIHTAMNHRDRALMAIAQSRPFPPPPAAEAYPILVFNDLNWQRSQVATLSPPDSRVADWGIWDGEGNPVESQRDSEGKYQFWAESIPAIGYRIYWLCPAERRAEAVFPKDYNLENDYLFVEINPETGDIAQIYDKKADRKILAGSGNQLEAYRDRGQYWDAWNIDPDYASHPLPPSQLKAIQWLEKGEVSSKIRVLRQIGESTAIQDYVLDIHSPLLRIQTQIDWQERHVLLKAAFPLAVSNDTATYEIPYAAIDRPTDPQTPAEKAKWEVPALRWADLSDRDGSYGVSLLNDCKYGYDARASKLRLTLLRSPQWPHPDCDRGSHQFTYALYPHSGNWQVARTVHQGCELNQPLIPIVLPPPVNSEIGSDRGQFIDLKGRSAILSACKQSEGDPNRWILRLYEAYGQPMEVALASELGLALGSRVNLLEEEVEGSRALKPWQVASFELIAATIQKYIS